MEDCVRCKFFWLRCCSGGGLFRRMFGERRQRAAAITQRGRALLEYDHAAWHATDAVQIGNP